MDKSSPNSLLNATLTSNEKTTNNSDYSKLVEQQREFFLSGATRAQSWRRAQLEAVRALFRQNHDELCHALWKDLRRNVIDADLMDVEYCAKEAEYALRHLATWMEPQRFSGSTRVSTKSHPRSSRSLGGDTDHRRVERAFHVDVRAIDGRAGRWKYRCD